MEKFGIIIRVASMILVSLVFGYAKSSIDAEGRANGKSALVNGAKNGPEDMRTTPRQGMDVEHKFPEMDSVKMMDPVVKDNSSRSNVVY